MSSLLALSSAKERLQALYSEDWLWEIGDNPEFASQAGVAVSEINWSAENALQHVHPASYQARAEHSQQMVDKVTAIMASSGDELTRDEVVVATLFASQHSDIKDMIASCPLFLIPINSIGAGGICWSFLESVEWLNLEGRAELEVLLSRVRACPAQLDEFIESMREGIKKGYVASYVMMRAIIPTLEDYVKVDAEPFDELKPALELAKKLDSELSTSYEADFLSGIATCRAGFQKMLSFMRDEYTDKVRSNPAEVGCSSLPCGLAGYEACLKFHTTTTLTANEIHEIGLQEVAKIEARYVKDVLLPLGYPSEDLKRFIETVNHDPQFYKETADELLDHYRMICERISKVLPDYFSEFPRSQLEIVKGDKGPSAFYIAGTTDGKRPGKFYVNCGNLAGKPTYECMSLSLHEAIPGHHHQVSLAAENEHLPKILRHIEDRRYECCPCRRQMYSAFVEGWALYCEYLGEEMGLYDTPYDIFGRLSMDMMRAVRLVVDTGIHAKGWTAEYAIEFFQQKTGMHRKEAEKEIYRYSSWPGQATAYKIGQLEILRLRRLAEAELGSKFNLKAFHSLCLNSGSLTLSILADMVANFIDKNR